MNIKLLLATLITLLPPIEMLASDEFKYKATGEFRSLYFDDLDGEIQKALQDKENISHLRYLISLLEVNTGFLFSDCRDLHWHVRAIPALIENYEDEALPDLLDYALKADKPFLQQRAVYVIEAITQQPVASYLAEISGPDKLPKRLQSLIWTGEDPTNLKRFFPETGPGKPMLLLTSKFEELPKDKTPQASITNLGDALAEMSNQVRVCNVLGTQSLALEHYLRHRGFEVYSTGGDQDHELTINPKHKDALVKLLKTETVQDTFRIFEIYE